MVEAVSAKPLRLTCPYSSQRQISFLSKTNFISLRPQNFHLSQCANKFQQLFKPSNKSLQFSGFGFNLKPLNNRNLWFHSNAYYNVENGGKMKGVVVDESEKAPGESTIPLKEGTDSPVWLSWLFGMFNLNKEALDRLLRWPWLIALAFGIYAWRTVLWESAIWKKGFLAAGRFMGYLLKLALAVDRFMDYLLEFPVAIANCTETALYTIMSCLCRFVATVLELLINIRLTTSLLLLAEAVVPDSANSQPYLLTLSGVVGLAAVTDCIPELVFWRLLMGIFCFSWFFKKRDLVTSLLPVAASLAAVGQLWLRLVIFTSYVALAISHLMKKELEGSSYVEAASEVSELPTLLLLAALSIGVHVAAKWIHYRHLTWMIG